MQHTLPIVADARNLEEVSDAEQNLALSMMCLNALVEYDGAVSAMTRVWKLHGRVWKSTRPRNDAIELVLSRRQPFPNGEEYSPSLSPSEIAEAHETLEKTYWGKRRSCGTTPL
jgi:ubiquinone/menaquinone biosynthesis C-methylase UbiE